MTVGNASLGEMEFVLFRNHQHQSRLFSSKYTTPFQPQFGRLSPDYAVKIRNKQRDVEIKRRGKSSLPKYTTIIGLFDGCRIKGCEPENKCPSMVAGVQSNPFGVSYARLAMERREHIKIYQEEYGVDRIDQMKECRWRSLKDTEIPINTLPAHDRELAKQVRIFLAIHYKARPAHERLSPRKALRGGKTDTFQFFASRKENPNKRILYIDYNSLYPSVCMTERKYLFPTGKRTILISPHDLADVSFKNNYTILKSTKTRIEGLCHLTILPPQNLEIPFLVTRSKTNDKSIAGLCRTCIDKGRQLEPCKHTDEQRQLTDHYTLSEVAYAINTLGYTLISLHEVWAYSDLQPIFKDLLSYLASRKIRASGWPHSDMSEIEKQAYCDEINEQLDFNTEGTFLRPEIIEQNEGQRSDSKLLQNKLLGKFGQENNKPSTLALSTQEEVNDCFYDETLDIKCMELIGPIMQLEVSQAKGYEKTYRKNNCIIGAYVTSAARVEMHENIRKVQAVTGSEILYSDTDSLIILLPDGEPMPLEIGNSYHQFSYEYEEYDIMQYSSLGPKNYSLKLRHKVTGEEKNIVKVRGFNLKSHYVTSLLTPEIMRDFVDGFLSGDDKKMTYIQSQISTNKHTREVYDEFTMRVFRSDVFNKRAALKNSRSRAVSLPFGYTKKMLKKVVKRQ